MVRREQSLKNYSFFVDLLHFYKEVSPSKNKRYDKLPDIILCKPQNIDNKVNILHLKEPYECITRRISHPVNDESEKSIEKEIRKWYVSIDDFC